MTTLYGRRVMLRPLTPSDFDAWREVRRRNCAWLTQWEPTRPPGQPDIIEDSAAFFARCGARQRERQLGAGYAFGVFVDDNFSGEMNLSSVQRGPFQNAYVGYWIDSARAGCGYTPEALVVAAQFAFETIRLHRLQISIIPRNSASRRVVEKLDLRCEGIAVRYLEINGTWEDHMRFAVTSEEWWTRRDEILGNWIS